MLRFRSPRRRGEAAAKASAGAGCRRVESAPTGASGNLRHRTLKGTTTATLAPLLALLGFLSPVTGQEVEAFFETSGEIVRGTAPETRLYWQSHLRTSHERILRAADLARGSKVATVLGSGTGMEIPLAELARRFDRLILVDLDGSSMVQSLHQVPGRLRAKIDLKVIDVTSFASLLIERIEHAAATSASVGEAFENFGSILDGLEIGHVADLPTSDVVVSSLLLSEIPRYPFSYAAQAVETRFGTALQTWDRSEEFFRKLVELAVDDHVQLLASLVKPGGVIYFSDTVARGLVRRAREGDVQRAVEARAVPDFVRLGLADSTAGVAPAVSRLCRAEHAPATEAEAFERILSLYRDADGRFFEPLLPVGEIRDRCNQRGLELRGSPASWWWLAYPCKIREGAGAFLISNWILGLRN